MQTSTSQHPQDKAQLAVSFKLLLSLYLIIPLCFSLQLFDNLFLDNSLLQLLPNSPSHFLLFQVLFGTPHILASTILLSTNHDYLAFYQRKILGMTLAIIVFFAIANQLISHYILYIMVSSWTVYHVLKQQIGVGRGLYQLPSWLFYSLLWLSVGAGICVYMGIFLKDTLSPILAEWVKHFASGFMVGLICTSILCQRYINNCFGKLFLWSNTALIVASFYFYLQEYYFFAILIPRLIHDATAYIFYIVHDINKHQAKPKNALYRFARKINLNIFLVLPLLSFMLTYILNVYGDQTVNYISQFFFDREIQKAISLGLIGYFSLMHYYTEAFTWKQGSPYRQFIRFKGG